MDYPFFQEVALRNELLQGTKAQKQERFGVKIPFCTIFLLIATISSFMITGSIGAKANSVGAVFGFAIFEKGQVYRLFTAMFLHANVGHILSNMILLCCLGGIVEKEFGWSKMLLLYFLPGIVGNVASAIYYFQKGEAVQTIGASAGIYGLLGVALFFCIVNRGEFNNITITQIMLFFALTIFEGLLANNVDIVAHAAGLLTGMILAGVVVYPGYQKQSK